MNPLDSLINFVSPTWGLRRAAARATMKQMEGLGLGVGSDGYDAGNITARNRGRIGPHKTENQIDRAKIDRYKSQAWALYRSNPYMRKLVSSLGCKVVGLGMRPNPQPVKADGTPDVDFARQARELWDRVSQEIDYRGRPGRGGQHLGDLQRTGFRGCALGGEILYRISRVDAAEQKQRGLTLPLELQLIDADRLDRHKSRNDENGNIVHGGIEFDSRLRRVAYWICPDESIGSHVTPLVSESTRVLATEIVHVYEADDIDQIRGVTWTAPAVVPLRDAGDYEQNELVSSTASSCVALVVEGGDAPQKNRIGLNQDSGSAGDAGVVTDASGNVVEKMSPGMVVYSRGKVNAFNPARPTANVAGFAQHTIRKAATGVPGVKGSTITGDYKGASFASERAADNDTWPEIEVRQQWWGNSFCQPLYEVLITVAIEIGYFEGVKTEDFVNRRHAYLKCLWQGPVQRSINPVDDIVAAALRMQKGLSAPQIEAAKLNMSVPDLLRQVAEFRQMVQSAGLPSEYADQVLGDTTPGATGGLTNAAASDDGSTQPGPAEDVEPEASEPADDPAPEADAESLAAAGDVAGAALNGAQISSLLNILTQSTAGTIPFDSVKPLIKASFPILSEKDVNDMVDPLKDFKPKGPDQQ